MSRLRSFRRKSTGDSPEDRECAICLESGPEKIFYRISCGHFHCQTCLAEQFRIRLSDTPFQPVVCCQAVELSVIKQIAPTPADFATYKGKWEEFSTEVKLYCWGPDCGTFIPTKKRSMRKGRCPRCRMKTCVKCKGKAHKDIFNCPPREADVDRLFQLAHNRHWQQCPSCHALVEKTDGCNSVRCRCGCSFCHRCGRKSMRCTCIGSWVGTIVTVVGFIVLLPICLPLGIIIGARENRRTAVPDPRGNRRTTMPDPREAREERIILSH